jgi:DNA invertase Pin-like site-specific DNA recombinase
MGTPASASEPHAVRVRRASSVSTRALTLAPALLHREHEEERRCALRSTRESRRPTPDNQLLPLRAFAAARGWTATEYVDHGVSGAKERRPSLDALLKAARGRKLDVIVVTKLDRLARSVHHLLTLARDLDALGVGLVVTEQAMDTTTPSGRLLFHVLASVAEFERDLIRERVVAGMRRARAAGKHLGRRAAHAIDAAQAHALLADGLSLRAVARQLGVHPFAVSRSLARRVAV